MGGGLNIAFTEKDASLVVISNPGRAYSPKKNVHIWDAASGVEIRTFKITAEGLLEVVNDGATLLSNGSPAYRIDLQTGKKRLVAAAPHSFNSAYYFDSARYSPNGCLFAMPVSVSSTSRGHRVTIHKGIDIWDVKAGRRLNSLATVRPTEILWSYNGERLYVATHSFDGNGASAKSYSIVQQWDVKNGRLLKSWKTSGWNSWNLIEWRSILVFWGKSPSTIPGDTEVGWKTSHLKAMEMKSGKMLWDIHSPETLIDKVELIKNGQMILSIEKTREINSALVNSVVVLRDIRTGQKLRAFSGDRAVSSPNGHFVAIMMGNTVNVWDISDIAQKPH